MAVALDLLTGWPSFDYLLQIIGSLKINNFKYFISGFKCKLLLNVSLLLLHKTVRTGYLNAVYFRRDLTCTVGLANNFIDGAQLGAQNDFLNVIWLHFT